MRGSGRDRLLEAYQRNKTRGIKTRREWHIMSIVVAGASFLISLFTFYTSSLRQVDELNVILEGNGTLFDSEFMNAPAIKIVGGKQVIFANTGTRPLTIVALNLHMHRYIKVDQSQNKCSSSSSKLYFVKMEPFILKQGEMVSKMVEYKFEKDAPDSHSQIAIHLSDLKGVAEITTCIDALIATLDNQCDTGEILLHRHYVGPQASKTSDAVSSLQSGMSPIQFVKRNRTTVNWINNGIDWIAGGASEVQLDEGRVKVPRCER